MKRVLPVAVAALAAIVLGAAAFAWFGGRSKVDDDARFARGETELEIANPAGARLSLFAAGGGSGDLREVDLAEEGRQWLGPGRYALRADLAGLTLWYPVPLSGYRSGPDEEGAFRVTVRNPPDRELPPEPVRGRSYLYVPAGTFLIGDRRNPREGHHVWLPAFFIAPFEVTNAEFRIFLADPRGYASSEHWTETGLQWRSSGRSAATAALRPGDREYERFGLDDHPVVWVNWFEVDAYCAWLTARFGEGRWLFTLPTEAQWEKVARGPESFDFALGMKVSDDEATIYNWRRNPLSDTSLVGVEGSTLRYRPNLYGAYHLTGNALEWTRSLYLPFNRDKPYEEGTRNARAAAGRRVARGGSWYSASNAYLLNSYRDAFQPEHCSQELGFRIVAVRLP